MQTSSAAEIDAWHRARGWRCIGYHYVIRRDGQIERGRPEEMPGAHCEGHNSDSIGICYEGGLDADGVPADTRTEAQKASMLALLKELRERYGNAVICGHRDFSNKACPCFDAYREYQGPLRLPQRGREACGWVMMAVMLMMVVACKPSRSVECHSDAVSVQSISAKDSVHSDYVLLFDRLDVWYGDSVESDSDVRLPRRGAGGMHLCITGGSVSGASSEVRLRQVADSCRMVSDTVVEPVFRPPRVNTWLVIFALLVLAFVVFGSRK